MDWLKVLQHGLKAFAFVILGALIAVILGVLNQSLNFIPSGEVQSFIWTWVVKPGIVALIAALTNWWSHK